jgi:hypothetical protein
MCVKVCRSVCKCIWLLCSLALGIYSFWDVWFCIRVTTWQALALWKSFRDFSIERYKDTYHRLNVHFDVYSGESQFQEGMVAVMKDLEDRKLVIDVEELQRRKAEDDAKAPQKKSKKDVEEAPKAPVDPNAPKSQARFVDLRVGACVCCARLVSLRVRVWVCVYVSSCVCCLFVFWCMILCAQLQSPRFCLCLFFVCAKPSRTSAALGMLRSVGPQAECGSGGQIGWLHPLHHSRYCRCHQPL